MDTYEKGPLIGVGIHGRVYRATHKPTQRTVALKKVCVADVGQGIALAAVREIAVARELSAPCFISLLDAFPHKKTLVLVFEYMEADLDILIKDKAAPLPPGNIKTYMRTLLQALDIMHSQGIMHRDIKPNNILVSAAGQPKLADFGLARVVNSPVARLTKEVGGRSYRAPELMFGAHQYTCMVDIWAAGCVFAEMLLRRVWFPGNSDMSQLEQVFKALGSPDVSTWPEVLDLPNFIPWKRIEAPPLASQFPPGTDPLALDLLASLMHLNPAHRLSAAQALQHAYFSSPPLPSGPEDMFRPCSKEAAQQPARGPSVLSRLMALHGPPRGDAHLPSTSLDLPSSVFPPPDHDPLGGPAPHGAPDTGATAATATAGGTAADDQVPGSFRFRIGQIPRRFSFSSSLNSLGESQGGSGSMAGVRRPLFGAAGGWRPSLLGLAGGGGPEPSTTSSEEQGGGGGGAAAAAGQGWAAAGGGGGGGPPPRGGPPLPLGLLSCSASVTPAGGGRGGPGGGGGEPTPTGPAASLPFTFAPTLASGPGRAPQPQPQAAAAAPTPAWPAASLAFPPLSVDPLLPRPRPTPPGAMSITSTAPPATDSSAPMQTSTSTAAAAPGSDLPSKRRRLFESALRPPAPPPGLGRFDPDPWGGTTPVGPSGASGADQNMLLASGPAGYTPVCSCTPELLCTEAVLYSTMASGVAGGGPAAAAGAVPMMDLTNLAGARAAAAGAGAGGVMSIEVPSRAVARCVEPTAAAAVVMAGEGDGVPPQRLALLPRAEPLGPAASEPPPARALLFPDGTEGPGPGPAEGATSLSACCYLGGDGGTGELGQRRGREQVAGGGEAALAWQPELCLGPGAAAPMQAQGAPLALDCGARAAPCPNVAGPAAAAGAGCVPVDDGPAPGAAVAAAAAACGSASPRRRLNMDQAFAAALSGAGPAQGSCGPDAAP